MIKYSILIVNYDLTLILWSRCPLSKARWALSVRLLPQCAAEELEHITLPPGTGVPELLLWCTAKCCGCSAARNAWCMSLFGGLE